MPKRFAAEKKVSHSLNAPEISQQSIAQVCLYGAKVQKSRYTRCLNARAVST
jgi:hypothetical protein